MSVRMSKIYAGDVATFKPLQGVTATDPLDGDITDDVTCECDLPEAFAAGTLGTTPLLTR